MVMMDQRPAIAQRKSRHAQVSFAAVPSLESVVLVKALWATVIRSMALKLGTSEMQALREVIAVPQARHLPHGSNALR